MYFFIYLEDLIANALIEGVERKGKNTVNFSQLEKYGEAIQKELKSRDIESSVCITKEQTKQCMEDYKDIFCFVEKLNDVKVILQKDVSTTYLRSKFRVKLAMPLLEAFVSKNALSAILDTKVETMEQKLKHPECRKCLCSICANNKYNDAYNELCYPPVCVICESCVGYNMKVETRDECMIDGFFHDIP